MRRLLSTAICLLFAQCILAQTPPQYPLRQYLQIRGALGPTISPDGKQVAFRTTLTGTSQLYRVKLNDLWPDQLTFFSSSISSAAWSPTGEWIAVVADKDGTEQFQFYLVNSNGTKLIELTNNTKIRFQWGGWSPDGKKIFYSSNERNPEFFDSYVLDVATRKKQLIRLGDGNYQPVALSHDGKTIAVNLFSSNVDTDLFLVDVATGKSKQVAKHTGEVKLIPIGFSADDKKLFLITDLDREITAIGNVDVASAKVSIVREEDHEVGSGVMSNNGKYLAYVVNRDGYEDLEIWDTLKSKRLSLPPHARGNVTLGDFSGDGTNLCFGLSTPTHSTDIYSLSLASGQWKQWTRSSQAGIDPSVFVAPKLIKYKSFDGKMIPAFLFLPKNASNNHSIPTIVSVHGGPEAQEKPLFTPIYQYFVSRGYAVLAPNIRGSAGYGKTYLASDNGPKRWDALKDLNAAVDFIGEQPQLDGKKVAIFGGSYGGFAVLAMMAHYSDRFAAGIDMFGVTDFKTFLANTAPYRRALRAAEYGDPVKDSVYMDEISPALHANQIKAPLLVIQGANDPRVPQSESEQIVAKVKANNRPVEYLLFPDEGHGIAKLPNRIRSFETIVSFLDKYLKK